MLDKKTLSERDICTKYITPALQSSGWDIDKQILEEVSFTDGKIFVRGKLTARGKRKRADYILYFNSNPIAIIEAKDNNHSINAGIQQALDYAQIQPMPVFPNIANQYCPPVRAAVWSPTNGNREVLICIY